MTIKSRSLVLTSLSCFVLLGGCDDGASSQDKVSWIDWLMGKDNQSPIVMFAAPSDYDRNTQAGNYLAGQFAQYRQDWSKAHLYLDKVIKIDPKNIDLQQRAMVLAMQAGDNARALGLARKVLQEDEKNLLALLFVGVDEIAIQNYAKARRTIAKMPSSGVADFVRPILVAWTQTPEKDVDLDNLIANGSLQAYHALLMADYMGKVDDPQKYFINILATGGADKHMIETMADVFARQGHIELAQKLYDTLLSEEEKRGTITSQYLALKEKRDAPEKVVGHKIQTPAQGAAEVFYNMARILMQDQSDESALVFARIAEELNPAKEDIKMLLAAMMVRAQHTNKAIEIYQSITPSMKGYQEAQRSAAELMEKEGRINDAIALLESNYSQTQDIISIVQIGDIHRRAKNDIEAIKAYDRAIAALGGKVSSDYWSILFSRGMSYEQSGNFKKAEEDLLAALEFQPDNAYLLNYLGYSWVDRGMKLEESLKMIERAVELKPDDGYIIDSLGWAYFKMDRYEDAVIELEKAVELVPYDPIINDHLGDAYWKVGRKNEARFQWSRAINASKDANDIARLEKKIDVGLVVSTSTIKEATSQKATDTAPITQQ